MVSDEAWGGCSVTGPVLTPAAKFSLEIGSETGVRYLPELWEAALRAILESSVKLDHLRSAARTKK